LLLTRLLFRIFSTMDSLDRFGPTHEKERVST
jgi:hypothetical protein